MKPPVISVLDFQIMGISVSDGQLIVDLLSSALVKSRKFKVFDRGQRNNTLYRECTDESCQLRIGKLLAADHIVVGRIGKASDRFIFNKKLLLVGSGESISTSYKVFRSLNELIDGCEEIA